MSPLSALMLLLALQVLAPFSVRVEGLVGASNSTSAPALSTSNNNSNATTNTTLCDSQQLFQKLYVLMPAINQCAMESDYFIKPDNLSLPSEASRTKFCGSKNCSKLSVELDNAGLPSCSVPVGNTTMPFKVFFKKVKSQCDNAQTTAMPAVISSSTYRLSAWHAAAATVLAILVAVGSV